MQSTSIIILSVPPLEALYRFIIYYPTTNGWFLDLFEAALQLDSPVIIKTIIATLAHNTSV